MKPKDVKQLCVENGKLRKALERLASVQAFEEPRAADPAQDRELLARIAYARANLSCL